MYAISTYCVVSCIITCGLAAAPFVYLGGTVNWSPVGDKVRFTYRLTFQKGSGPCGPGCSSASLTKPGTALSSLQWECTSGCTGSNLNTVNYIVTSIHDKPFDWEHGEGSFRHKFTGTGPFFISLENLAWSSPAVGPGRLQTTVDLGIRNDTSLPNVSPVTAVPPYIGVPFGCTTTIELPVMDPDADSVTCRMSSPSECGDACTSNPQSITLDQTNCVLIVTTTKDKGYAADHDYRIAITVEDFPEYLISVGGKVRTPRDSLSTVPFQFTIHVKSSMKGCTALGTEPVNVIDHKIALPYISSTVQFNFSVESQDRKITNVAASVPAGTKIQTSTDLTKPNRTRIATQWTPGGQQQGLALFCVWGVQKDGLSTTKKDCFSTITDRDDCGGTPCQNAGTCIDLYHRYACKCTLGYKGKHCTQRASCKTDNPCRNGGRCEDSKTKVSCICPKGFTGSLCRTDIALCTSYPCLHGGTCQDDAPGSFKCKCVSGFSGSLCETASNLVRSTTQSSNPLLSSKQLQATSHSGVHGRQPNHKPSLQLPTDAIVQYTPVSSNGKDILDKLNGIGLLSIQDKNRQKVDVKVDNKGPETWPIALAVVGSVLLGASIFGCCYLCRPCGPKLSSKVKDLPDLDKKVKHKDDVVGKRGTRNNTASNNHGPVNQINTDDLNNSGVLVTGGSPRILNIYKSSVNDPFLHKCGTPRK